MRAFIRATWLVEAWNLLPTVMDTRIEFADFPSLLEGKALGNRMQGEEILIVDEDRVTEDTLDCNRNLKLIGTPTAGLNHIDVASCTKRGIVVVNAPGVNADSVAEFAFALILALTRKIVNADTELRKGFAHELKSYSALMGMELKGKTIGVVGAGHIGSRVATIAKGFGMQVLLYDPIVLPTYLEQFGKPVEMDELFRNSDVISVHVPLTKQTLGMISENHLRQMKKTAFFVNTSRGTVVNEADLIRALKEKWIAGAGLDVQAHEPLTRDDLLLTLDNVIVTPHIASISRDAQQRCDQVVQEEVIRFAKGQRLRFVANPEVLHKH
ncbi:MAG TPA: NAD(P)-dependent oxidoreductase [Methylomirabilota bacterium]|nr:NAD(P)-dependent oxidoreductase [Methylomirabilota bacterium]